MIIFTWIVLGVCGLLFLVSGICWGVSVLFENADWKKLSTKAFRIALVFVLFYINAYIYMSLVRVVSGEKPAPSVLEPAEE